MLKAKPDGIYALNKDGEERKISGPIEVKAIVSSHDKRDDFGRLLEWKNYFGLPIREVLPMGEVDDNFAKKFKKRLLRSGFQLSPGKYSWESLLAYLIETPCNKHAYSARQSGWVDGQFVTPDWSIGRYETPAVYVGDFAGDSLVESGSLLDWQQNIGKYCRGNPIMILAVCAALAAPIIGWTDLESFGIQIVGSSKSGKSTVMKVAASIYSDQTYWETWSSTSNGIESIARARNNMLLCLDEFKQCPAQEIGQLIYHLCNGVSKLRSQQDGALDKRYRWRTIFLSTGELTLEELLLGINQSVSAGQSVRLIEVPVFSKYDAFENTHGFTSAKEFAEHLSSCVGKYHGTFIKSWVEALSKFDCPNNEVIKEYKDIREQWPWPKNIESQANNVLDKFALLAAAGEIAINLGLLPWHLGEAKDALEQVATIWLDDRNSTENSESKKIIKKLIKLINKWRHSLSPRGESHNGSIGYFESEPELAWYIPQQLFKSEVIESVAHEYSQTVHYMLQKGWALSNEGARRTFKIGGERFIKFFPEKICRECGESVDLSHFHQNDNSLNSNANPTFPVSQSENY
ncbi:DUF927 domain-containing protein [Pseudoalteromonas sp. Cnat2-41]|uniref:DUF927 domain-containing protein n=1 Tax=unclassified Pseudoalteromonas TaxID=194690 RepID=UPI001EF7A878|nr:MULTISPECIES: DUF927 domain-containing protein [unclassified Pseudoalteromonas]MCF2862908.1 DUF927 domain-containing protein [Pseudoalteromonas sp. CNAT2-18]MCG7558640.1 DUF927 domain-containing protein [Pseudoalteromonas sp. CNAT2-18.1]